jgi:glycosyltransferase involved in cell wall biosynthesis
MSSKPTISIIMASYNHADFIGQAIESVQRQDYDAWELLIADDASTDQTLEVVRSYLHDPRIHLLPFTNNREYHMRNAAAEQACGEYLAFLNSDDLFYAGKLNRQVTWLEQHPQTAAVFTHVHCINDKNERLDGHRIKRIMAAENMTSEQWLRHFFYSGNRLCISSAMIRRECFEQVGGFNPLLIQIGDLDLWIKLCLSKHAIYVIPEPLTANRLTDRNLSNLNPASRSRLVLEEQETFIQYFSPDALEQIPEIFPEIMATLPEDTLPWRQYLLCRAAAGQPRNSMKLLGFKSLHALLSKQETRLYLQQNNPRLLRTLFFSEGTAGLHHKSPQAQWRISFSESDKSEEEGPLLSYWTDTTFGTVCLSFPNPGLRCRLQLSFGNSVRFECRKIRLFNQQSGRLIIDFNLDPPLFKFDDFPCYHFPEIDFSVIQSKWIDIEIERTPLKFQHIIRKSLARIHRKLRKKR